MNHLITITFDLAHRLNLKLLLKRINYNCYVDLIIIVAKFKLITEKDL